MITSDFNWNAAEAAASRHARVDFQERLLRKTELETGHVAKDADISARIERCDAKLPAAIDFEVRSRFSFN